MSRVAEPNNIATRRKRKPSRRHRGLRYKACGVKKLVPFSTAAARRDRVGALAVADTVA
jgi:hypothetical protein